MWRRFSTYEISLVVALIVMLLVQGPTSLAVQYPGSIFDQNWGYSTYKPLLLGKHWVGVAGEPLSATAGALIFAKGGNAVDAAAAMLAATCVMNDSVSFGGEMPGLIYDPRQGRVFAINGQGIAPTGATAEFFRSKGLSFPPPYGPLAATTPGIPGALIEMLSEFGTMSLKEVLAPAIDMANGYPIEAQTATIYAEDQKQLEQWKYSKEVFLPGGKPPEVGQIFVQKNLAGTLRKLVAAEQAALAAGKSRKEALKAAKDRFYKGDIAVEFVRASQEYGGLHTLDDMAKTEAKIKVEEPLHTSYRGLEVYKCDTWTQGATLLQALNLLEGFDLKAMGHNTSVYIHTIYQAMNLAFADRDFYYGDPSFSPVRPIKGLLSKEYASERRKLMDAKMNNPKLGPGDPYPFQGETNPFVNYLKAFTGKPSAPPPPGMGEHQVYHGTTSVQAADEKGWVVSLTPSGGWPPAFIAGTTGVGMSQRMQQFVGDPSMNPYNVVEPGKRPRITITPTLVMKDGHPFLSSSLPGGDVQEQMQLQFFLDVVEFGMDIQEAVEAPKFESFQMHGSFGLHPISPGLMTLDRRIPREVADTLTERGYRPVYWKGGVKGEHGGTLTVDSSGSGAQCPPGRAGHPGSSVGRPPLRDSLVARNDIQH
jgi:gamma-glutamyltranspeptidase/glutathione hydrolase